MIQTVIMITFFKELVDKMFRIPILIILKDHKQIPIYKILRKGLTDSHEIL